MAVHDNAILAPATASPQFWRRACGHDIKAPFRQAAVYASFLREDAGQLPPTAVESLDRLDNALERGLRGVKRFALWAGMDTQRQDWQTVDVRELILAHPAKLSGVPDALSLHGDPQGLALLWQELLDNLLAHAGGSAELQVTRGPDRIDCFLRQSETRLNAEEAARWLSPLADGRALGLALCARVCALHGATLRWSTSSGQGAGWRLDWPNRGT